jgi:hypothetical protein
VKPEQASKAIATQTMVEKTIKKFSEVETVVPFDQRAGVVLTLSGSARAGRICVRRPVKAQPKNAQDFTYRSVRIQKKRTATKPNLLDPDSNFI